MSDDLFRCGPQMFEQLVQALAVQELGPGLSVLGAGRDGGREAVFNGPVTITSHGSQWNGYGVVQAKHKQFSEGTTEDAAWVRKTITHECETWLNKRPASERPRYLLFATNVRLTPYPGSGGHDTVQTVLDKYKKRLDLDGIVLWHGDTLSAMLDNHPRIRQTYAAWITSGDVLSMLLRTLQADAQDSVDVLVSFVANELLAHQRAGLDQAGDAGEHAVPLSSVFVDLHAEDQRLRARLNRFVGQELQIASKGTHGPRVLALLAAAGDHQLKPSLLGQNDTNSVEVKLGRWVIVGGPGQGKSTLGQFLCQLYRAELLHGHPMLAGVPELKTAVRAMRLTASTEGIAPACARRWPLHLPLAQLADALAEGTAMSVLDFIAQRCSRRTSSTVTVAQLRRWLSSYPWCVVLDGLDEVPVSSNREQLMTAVRDFRVDIASLDADVLLVATTRPQGYDNEFSPESFNHIVLAPMSTELARHYGRRLITARYDRDSDDTAALIRRLHQAADTPPVSHLMTTPLQVTIMAMLLTHIGEAPSDRFSLFTEYYNTIYRRELGKNITTSRVLRAHRGNIDAVHASVGMLLQARSELSGDTSSYLDHRELVALIDRRLEDEGFDPVQRAALAQQLGEVATDRLVFLVGHTDREIGFELRSLQEYCAAVGLTDGSATDVPARLSQISTSAHWRNVILLACGRLFHDMHRSRDLVVTLCLDLNSTDEVVQSSGRPGGRSTLIGSRLAAELLEDGIARNQPRYRRLLLDVAVRLLELPLKEDHERLTSLAQVDDLVDGLRQRLLEQLRDSRGEQRMPALAVLATLADRGHRAARSALYDVHAAADHESRLSHARHAVSSLSPSLLEVCALDVLHLSVEDVHLLLPPQAPDDTYLPGTRLESAPWLLPALSVIQAAASRRAAFVTVDGTHIGRVSYVPVDDGVQYPAWQCIVDMPDGDHQWAWVRAAAQFASSPTTDHLATAVDAVHTAGLSITGVRIAAQCTPWPLGNAIAEGAHGAEIRAGAVGQPKDWILHRQQNLDIPLNSILTPEGGRFPSMLTMRIVGFPPVSTTLPTDAVASALSAWTRDTSSASQLQRASTAAFLLEALALAADAEQLAEANLEAVWQVALSAAEMEVLPVQWVITARSERLLPLLDELGRLPVRWGGHLNEDLIRGGSAVVGTAFLEDTSAVGLGRLAEIVAEVTPLHQGETFGLCPELPTAQTPPLTAALVLSLMARSELLAVVDGSAVQTALVIALPHLTGHRLSVVARSCSTTTLLWLLSEISDPQDRERVLVLLRALQDQTSADLLDQRITKRLGLPAMSANR